MTANLVFVLNLIMAAVIVFYKKTESEIWQTYSVQQVSYLYRRPHCYCFFSIARS